MIILHTLWRDGGLSVWGEREAQTVKEAEAGARTPDSPFDAGASRLWTALKPLLWGEEAGCGQEPLELALPSLVAGRVTRPLPSQPFLAAEAPAAEGTAALRPWRVTSVRLGWKAAFMLLGRCQERRLADDVFAGEELLALSELFRYAGALVARGRFLPALSRSASGAYEALWRPALDAAELARFRVLSERLPPCAADGCSRTWVSRAFLEECVDRLVRFSVVTTLSRAQAERGSHYSAHDAWFSALRGEGRAVRWEDAAELESLRQSLRRWRLPVETGAQQDGALLFCLEPPPGEEGLWRLRVLVSGSGGEQAGLPLRERALRALGQAALLHPPLERAEPQEDGGLGCWLDAHEAHAFLTGAAALLEAAGYATRLPEWWREGARHALALEAEVLARPGEAAEGARALDEHVDVRWSVTLNGEPVTPEELERLLDQQAPLVFFRGQWIQLDLKQLRDALRVWRRKRAESRSAIEMVRLALGTGGGHYGLEVSQVRGCGWFDPLLKRLSGEEPFEVLDAPQTFCGELRPYQQRGFSWLCFLKRWGFGACLADDMGLGKTIQALAFLLHEKAAGVGRPALLVGPMSVLGNWLHEAQRFAPNLRCLLHHGPGRWHGDSFAREASEADLVITSYALLYRDYSDLRKVPWSGLLLDEAQNIKNPDTHQAQAARAVQADYRVALTGTPMENHVGDLWSLMDFLNPGMLGKRSVFREAFFRPIQAGTDPGALARLRRVTAPFILRRLKTDRQIISDLPPKVEGKVFCPLTREQARLYKEVLDDFNREVELSEGLQRRGLILAVLTRLKQVCNHPENYLRQRGALERRSGKLERLLEMLEECFERGESALIFTQYAEMGTLLARHLRARFARDMPFLHGGLSRRERDRLVSEFQASVQPQAFVLSLKAGGTGLNLTRATHVFHYDRWWNPAVENQATDRAFRIGQTRRVMVHTFICGGTLEERIDAMIERKTELTAEIVTSGEAFLTELSNAELREILSLSETAVTEEE